MFSQNEERAIIELIKKYSSGIATSVIQNDPDKIPATIGEATGDLIVFSSPANPTRLPVGLRNYVLATDDNASVRISWKELIGVAPIEFDNFNIILRYSTTNLRLNSGVLDTIQNITTTSTPTFTQLILSNQATASNHSVRADRAINTNAPLTGGGNLTNNRNLGLNYNTTNFKLTSDALNTIQDIATTSSPTFQQLFLNIPATNTNHSVRADRIITTNAPLTGGGNLTNDRSLGLNYNTTNFRLTSDALNTIQDIATTSSPTFAGLIINGNILASGNSYISNSYTFGWSGNGYQLDYSVTTANKSSLEIDDLTVRGTMRVFEFIINQIKATNGSLFVSSSAKVVSATLSPGETDFYTIVFEDPEGHNVTPFAVNDIIMAQRVRLDSTTIVKRIICRVTNVSGLTVTAEVLQRTGTIDKNDLVVRIGNTTNTNRQGNIYLTSEDTNAPYIDVADGVNSLTTWQGNNKIKVRLGKLNGISDAYFGNLAGYGLYARDNVYLKGKIYAEAGGYIAGWDIDSDKLSKSTCSLVATSNMAGLVVDNDKIKIGQFATTTPTNNATNINTLVLNGYNGINANDTAWGVVGNYWIGSNSYTPILTRANNYLNIAGAPDISSWSYAISRRLFNDLNYLRGKKTYIRLKVRFTLGIENIAYSGGDYEIAIRYYDSSFNTLYRQVIDGMRILDDLSGSHLIDYTSVPLVVKLPDNIPNVAYTYLEIYFTGGAQSGTYYPYDMELTDYQHEAYLNYKTWINDKGLLLYNDEDNYIKLYDNYSDLNVSNIKIRDKNIVRFHGILSNAPNEDINIGDIYIRASDKKVLMCNNIDNIGVPQWTLLN